MISHRDRKWLEREENSVGEMFTHENTNNRFQKDRLRHYQQREHDRRTKGGPSSSPTKIETAKVNRWQQPFVSLLVKKGAIRFFSSSSSLLVVLFNRCYLLSLLLVLVTKQKRKVHSKKFTPVAATLLFFTLK